MSSQPPTIGLTGGIGSGKSTVAAQFYELGCIVANADKNAKTAMQNKDVIEQLVGWWGKEILNDDGSVNHGALAAIVFNEESQRIRLESLLHPLAKKLQEEQFSMAGEGTKALVIDAPLLLETGLDKECDAIVFVDASIEIRQKRVQKDRNWSVEEINRREAVQLPLDTKRDRADYVVINEGELGRVHNQVKQILEDVYNRRH